MSMVCYQNGKIYKITHASCTKCSIGSICATLSQRVPRHRVAEGAIAVHVVVEVRHFRSAGKPAAFKVGSGHRSAAQGSRTRPLV